MRCDGIITWVSASIRAAVELDEAMAQCRVIAIAAQQGVAAEEMIREAKELEKTTTMSTTEAMEHVLMKRERAVRYDRAGEAAGETGKD